MKTAPGETQLEMGEQQAGRKGPERPSLNLLPSIPGRFVLLACWILAVGLYPAGAALQFDVFPGYDGIVPEGSWFPVVCEIKNDGPPFAGVVEVTSGDFNQGQVRRAEVELPTGTLKRLVIPVFSTSRYAKSWDVRLLDERGKVRAEQVAMRPRKELPAAVPLIGALSRTASGTPVIRPLASQQSGTSEFQPVAARLLPSLFPDNPLVLEGMKALYVSSEKAPELTVNQVRALLAWLNAGGHLIVAVEQIADVTGTPWLKGLVPVELKEMQPVTWHPELQEWLRSDAGWTNSVSSDSESARRYRARHPGSSSPAPEPGTATSNPFSNLEDDPKFENAELLVARGQLRGGRVEVAAGDTPLMVTAHRGQGRVTALLFSVEREPVRSWKNLPTFWAKLGEVPGAWYAATDFNARGNWTSDGIFGAMIDSKQVHKLPVGWLLLLLMVYLVVIGPLDQFWLKRIGRPMLTWITFPCYVVLFSLVIYFIGYKLRAGESEWNELHLVDVLASGDRAELRGQTYVSVYSPANQKYQLESQQKYATFRGEFLSYGNPSGEKGAVMQKGDSFKAEIFVPVWMSQLFVSDWWHSAPVPLEATVTARADGWQVTVENRTERDMTEAKLAIEDWIFKLGEIPAGKSKTFTLGKGQGQLVGDFVSGHAGNFQQAVQQRQHAFGGRESGRLSDLPNTTVAASFISQLSQQQSYGSFVAPPGLDLSPVLEHGQAVIFAWAGDYSPVKPMQQFTPKRSHRDTLWRLAVAVQ